MLREFSSCREEGSFYFSSSAPSLESLFAEQGVVLLSQNE